MDKQIFHDMVGNLNISNGVARLDFYDLELPGPGQPAGEDKSYAFAGRLVLPLPALVQLHRMTGEVLRRLEQAGREEAAKDGTA